MRPFMPLCNKPASRIGNARNGIKSGNVSCPVKGGGMGHTAPHAEGIKSPQPLTRSSSHRCPLKSPVCCKVACVDACQDHCQHESPKGDRPSRTSFLSVALETCYPRGVHACIGPSQVWRRVLGTVDDNQGPASVKSSASP